MQEVNQIADHKQRMNERRAQFSEQYANVWAAEQTGTYMCHLTVQDSVTGDNLITHLFQDNIVADARRFKHPTYRSFSKRGHQIVEDGEHKVIMVTSDDRQKDLVTSVGNFLNNEKFDLIFIPIATGNKNYIEWVSNQTIKPSAAQKALSQETEVPDDQIDVNLNTDHLVVNNTTQVPNFPTV